MDAAKTAKFIRAVTSEQFPCRQPLLNIYSACCKIDLMEMCHLKEKLIPFLATGCYLGYLPFAPGTFGTLLAIPLIWINTHLAYLEKLIFIFGIIFLFLFIVQLYLIDSKQNDPSEVVLDEVVGFLIAMFWLPLTWQSLLLGFMLFRFFDIVKPFPISYIDKNVKGAVGVFADDLLAGLVVNILLQALHLKTEWLIW